MTFVGQTNFDQNPSSDYKTPALRKLVCLPVSVHSSSLAFLVFMGGFALLPLPKYPSLGSWINHF